MFPQSYLLRLMGALFAFSVASRPEGGRWRQQRQLHVSSSGVAQRKNWVSTTCRLMPHQQGVHAHPQIIDGRKKTNLLRANYENLISIVRKHPAHMRNNKFGRQWRTIHASCKEPPAPDPGFGSLASASHPRTPDTHPPRRSRSMRRPQVDPHRNP